MSEHTIALCARTEEHVRFFFAATQNPLIRAHMPLKAQTAEEALADFRHTQLPGADSFGRTIYLDGRYIGDIWCYCMNLAGNPQAMLSYCLFDPTVWNRGIATEAVGQFLRLLDGLFGIRRVGAFTFLANAASVRVLEKNGFTLAEQPEPGSGYFVR